MSLTFDLQLERERFAPGDGVRGTVTVREGGRSRALEVLLEYHEKTQDYEEVARSVSSGPLHTGDIPTGLTVEFDVALPADALPNCSSPHGALFWRVDVKSDERGIDSHERRRIEVGPAA